VSDVVGGSCLCGAVRFEVTLPFKNANYCHCSRCAKGSGSWGHAQGRIDPEQFRFLQGEDRIRVWRPPDGGAVKAFCAECGSSLFGAHWPEGPEISIRFGALDGDPGIRPQYHSFVDSRLPWVELPEDGLPRYPERPPQ
jgi:hypothetical protein